MQLAYCYTTPARHLQVKNTIMLSLLYYLPLQQVAFGHSEALSLKIYMHEHSSKQGMEDQPMLPVVHLHIHMRMSTTMIQTGQAHSQPGICKRDYGRTLQPAAATSSQTITHWVGYLRMKMQHSKPSDPSQLRFHQRLSPLYH